MSVIFQENKEFLNKNKNFTNTIIFTYYILLQSMNDNLQNKNFKIQFD